MSSSRLFPLSVSLLLLLSSPLGSAQADLVCVRPVGGLPEMEDIAKAFGYVSAIVFPSMFQIRDILSANGLINYVPDVVLPDTCPFSGDGFSWKEHSEVFEMFGWDQKFVEEFLMTGGVTSGEWFAQRKSIYENVLAKADMLVKLNSGDRDVKVGNLVKGLLTSLDMECSPPRLVAASLIMGSFLTRTLCGENTADLKSAGIINSGVLGKLAFKVTVGSLNAAMLVLKIQEHFVKLVGNAQLQYIDMCRLFLERLGLVKSDDTVLKKRLSVLPYLLTANKLLDFVGRRVYRRAGDTIRRRISQSLGPVLSPVAAGQALPQLEWMSEDVSEADVSHPLLDNDDTATVHGTDPDWLWLDGVGLVRVRDMGWLDDVFNSLTAGGS